MTVRLPIVPGNRTPPHLVDVAIRRYRLIPRGEPAYAWIDLAELRPGYWLAGYAAGLRHAPLGVGRAIGDGAERWPNAHNAWFACLGRIDAFWRRLPDGLASQEVASWIDWLATEDFEGLFAPAEFVLLK